MIESYLSVRMKDKLQTNEISSKPTWLYFTAYGFILTLHIIILYPNVFTGLVISNQLFRYWRQVVAQYNQKCHPNAKKSHETPKISVKTQFWSRFSTDFGRNSTNQLTKFTAFCVSASLHWSHDLKSISLFRQWRQVVAECNQKCHSGGNLFDCFDFCGVLRIIF